MANNLIWKKIPLDLSELKLSTVLRCGQTFRWKQKDNIFSMAYRGRVFLIKQDDKFLSYSTISSDKTPKIKSEETDDDIISDYFNLNVNLGELYDYWVAKDTKFKAISKDYQGIRILRQDPWENLCSFICSSNNNIKRISSMVENLCLHFGQYIASHDEIDYYDFPSPDKLAQANVEQKLRDLGFGYRAKYIHKTAQLVNKTGMESLYSLRKLPYKECHEALLNYVGVGPKVADCVCLMSLDKHDCVPVDTHVWQIAQRDYKFGRKYKLLNKIAYQEIGDFFRQLWGPYAGWAQSVVFTADLPNLDNGFNASITEKRTAQDFLENEPLVKKVAA